MTVEMFFVFILGSGILGFIIGFFIEDGYSNSFIKRDATFYIPLICMVLGVVITQIINVLI